nr:MAG: hypothetical protein [Caudoviricetes sp.]
MNQNNQQDIWSKIYVLERDLQETQRSLNKLDSSYSEIIKKLEHIKDELRNLKSVSDLEKDIREVEEMVDSLRQEMPEMRIIRKIVFALVAFILTAFLGLIWNTVIFQKTSGMRIDNSQEVVKKIVDEYNKGNK